MDRHEWGGLHFWMAVALLAALAIHVFFHWKWVVSMIRGRPREGSGRRLALAGAGAVALIALVAAPLLSPVDRNSEARGARTVSHESNLPEAGVSGRPAAETGAPSDAEAHEDHQIRGSMTLGEVEDLTGVPASVIVSELGLPASTDPEEKLGQLRRAHGFEMARVREIVAEHAGG